MNRAVDLQMGGPERSMSFGFEVFNTVNVYLDFLIHLDKTLFFLRFKLFESTLSEWDSSGRWSLIKNGDLVFCANRIFLWSSLIFCSLSDKKGFSRNWKKVYWGLFVSFSNGEGKKISHRKDLFWKKFLSKLVLEIVLNLLACLYK